MNIICVIFDSLRKDCIGAYGKPFWGEVKTPNLDRFNLQRIPPVQAVKELLARL